MRPLLLSLLLIFAPLGCPSGDDDDSAPAGDDDDSSSVGDDDDSAQDDDDSAAEPCGAIPLGSAPECPATDCAAVLAAIPAAQDGLSWIDPQASGTPYQVFCDMSQDGGGWTLVANIDDVDDPYFGGHATDFYGADWVAAWESDSVRNPEQIATFAVDLNVSAKYRSWSEVPATDLRIAYKNDGSHFVGLGLDGVDTLDALFASPPAPGQCSSTFTSVDENRFGGGFEAPAGLNCSDPNEGWYIDEALAENARIGAMDSSAVCCVALGWLGTLGDRAFEIDLLEKTWGTNWDGAAADDNILLFVR